MLGMPMKVKRLLLSLQLTLLLHGSSFAFMKKQMVAERDREHPQEETCVIGNDGVCLNNVPPIAAVENDMIEVPYGEKQSVVGESADNVKERLKEIQKYMYETVYPTMGEIGPHCKLNNQDCTFWAVIGECEKNPKYMKVECAPACFSCDQLSFDARCPMPDKDLLIAQNVWKGGDMHKMFERIVAEYEKTTVLLKPGMPNPKYDDSPWVIVIDDFLSEEECKALIELGAVEGYERSKDVGAKKFDGTYDSHLSSGRTSSNAWCTGACYNHTMTKSVLAKIEKLTGVPDANSEYLQLLQYEKDQFYESHHDYIEFHLDREQGVRIITVFLYLNDVEEGGETNFPDLDLTVKAKQGRVLVWPSVLDEDPNKKDHRTQHQALPVKKGIKYGANAWLHLRDFKAPFERSCI